MNSLSVPSTTTGHRVRQVQAAKEWQDFVEEKATRTGSDPPPYEFLELIGKGSFGRVYKAKDRNTQNIVAVKVVEIDDQDYRERPHTKDENIKSFFKEINVLQQLKESKAKNINIIYDAFSVHSYLWLVSEYCPGGSVHTLMKPCTKGIGLEERFIIPIARELAIALKTVHEAGVLHRDVKCANILVTEDGRVQLCDFGVAAVLESNAAKRTTVLGTPHWSPPEMVSAMKNQGEKALPYGAEFDCWAFGCTVYELATGLPPNSNLDIFRLPITLRRAPPRLQGDQYSPGLRDFVAFCLELRPEDRPTAAEILAHPYITNTSEHYPTDSLTELIERYAKWEQEGGHRASLFNPFGAQAPVTGQDAQLPWTEDDEWNFSYTEQFAREHRMPTELNTQQITENNVLVEAQIERGAKFMGNLFDPTAKPYSYNGVEGGRRTSFLPLANDAPIRSTSLNVNEGLDESHIEIPNLDDAATIKPRRSHYWYSNDDYSQQDDDYQYRLNETRRATRDWTMARAIATAPLQDKPDRKTKDSDSQKHKKRGTLGWTFATAIPEGQTSSMSDQGPSFGYTQETSFRPPLRHAATMQVVSDLHHTASAPDSPVRTSMIDLDLALPADYGRPSTSGSTTDSQYADLGTGDPFDLEDQVHLTERSNRMSIHMKSASEPTQQLHNRQERPSRIYKDEDGGPHQRNESTSTASTTDVDFAFHDEPVSWNQRDAYGQYQTSNKTGASNLTGSSSQMPSYGINTDDEDESDADGRTGTYRGRSTYAVLQPATLNHPQVSVEASGRRICDAPLPDPPHPSALIHDADADILASELARTARDLEEAMSLFADNLDMVGMGTYGDAAEYGHENGNESAGGR